MNQKDLGGLMKYRPELLMFEFLLILVVFMTMYSAIGCSPEHIVYNTQESVPALQPASPVYIGCYVDAPTRALPAFLLSSGATLEDCVALAKSLGYAFAGLQYGVQCFAGDTLGFSPAPATDCDMPCNADPSETCGGVWRNSIYSTGL
jgi:hypothetical protein